MPNMPDTVVEVLLDIDPQSWFYLGESAGCQEAMALNLLLTWLGATDGAEAIVAGHRDSDHWQGDVCEMCQP